MTENRVKLNFRPAVIIGEKSPPPTGLRINHGKPNFTIQRQKSKPNNTISNNLQSEQNGTLNRRLLLKKTTSNEIVIKTEDDKEKIEFLEKHKKISEKIAKDNIENNITMEENNNTGKIKIETKIEQNFVKTQNGILNNGTEINLKPALPEKPAALLNYKPTSPTNSNFNGNLILLKKPNYPPPPKPPSAPILPSSQNGVNFEQKTFVSFSKDLSSEPNKYPETVKITKPIDQIAEQKDKVLEELTKLKFEIVSNGEEVVPVVRN